MRKIAFILILFFSNFIYSQDVVSFNGSFEKENKEVILQIAYEDQKTFYPSDKISLKFTIKNDSPNNYHFKLSDNKVFNLNLSVMGLDNQVLPQSTKFAVLSSYNKVILYRNVTILPGEEFSFTQDLSNYKKLKEGVYIISATFFPLLNTNAENRKFKLISNNLALSVKPEFLKTGSNLNNDELEKNIIEKLLPVNIPPDKVILYMLNAKLAGNMEKFFLYLNLEDLYTMNPKNKFTYKSLSESARFKVIDNFKKEIWNDSIGEFISLTPINFKIINTTYTQSEATVIVKQSYKISNNSRYLESKKVTYKLIKDNNIWKVVSYEVLNLNNELIE